MLHKNRPLILFLWLLLIIPIGYLAILGIHHTRSQGGGQLFFSRNGRDFFACEWVSNKYFRFDTLCLDSEPTTSPRDSFSIKTARTHQDTNTQNTRSWTKDLLGLGLDEGIGWGIFRTGETSATAYQFDLTNAEPAKISCIEFGTSISSTFRMLIIDDKLIRVFGEQLEMWDISTGIVLDSIATPMGPKSYFYQLPGTRNFLVLDTSTNSTELYETNNENLHSIQEWKALQTQPFQRNDEWYLASLLPDGRTIEVRNAIDGSVVSSTTSPSDSRLTLPLANFDLRETCGCIRWSSLGIWTDIFTGQSLPIPDSFEPLVRDLKNSRLVATRNERTNGVIVSKECVVVDETTEEQLLRFPLDLHSQIYAACILKKSGHLALATSDHCVHLYDVKTGIRVRVIDPFKWGFPLNGAAATLFGLWCIGLLRFAAVVHSHGWIDASICIGLFMAYASFRIQTTLSVFGEDFYFAGLGMLIGSIQLTSVWLCLGRNRLFLRTGPFVLAFGIAAGLVTYWQDESKSASAVVAAIMPLSLGMVLAFTLLRWGGVKFENVNLQPFAKPDSVLQKESSIHLRDLFIFTLVSAIVAFIVKGIPVTYWYEILLDRQRIWVFLFLVCIHAACLAAGGVLALWTSLSRRNIVVRWLPWSIALVPFLLFRLPLLSSLVFGSFATLMLGLHAYRLRGWRFNLGRKKPTNPLAKSHPLVHE